ncbi:rubrerythrin [Desulfosporosinus orientis DSM 765]|uniref:Rubrerythrin n=1 Tax=Desulfosporosinus orientis (strain ATCC 19365 / DSM 765 / NCIMB 8382 / VKM B-1628 / Singapore I) TaxID=768706 RepID=G7W7K2_DESOD|nr:rubrerythrin family protein [Desulfosporosinus orientis]AET65921.1 rubrerythrin [Desulfosporosinus orientis DSM 765]
MKFSETETFKNLSDAFAGESQARNRYAFFAGVAKQEGYQHIQTVFEETAANEKEHAEVFYKLLIKHTQEETNIIHVDADYPLVYKDTLTNLRAAVEGEREEWAEIYAKFGTIADQEGFADIAVVLRKIAEVEKHHMDRFEYYANGIEKGSLFHKEKPTVWKCTNCGYVHEGPDAPNQCPACAHSQGYFEELPEKY